MGSEACARGHLLEELAEDKGSENGDRLCDKHELEKQVKVSTLQRVRVTALLRNPTVIERNEFF